MEVAGVVSALGAVFVYAVLPPCLRPPSWGGCCGDGGHGVRGGAGPGFHSRSGIFWGGGACDGSSAGCGGRRRLRFVGERLVEVHGGGGLVFGRGFDLVLAQLAVARVAGAPTLTTQRSSVFTMHDLVYDLARSVVDEEMIVYNADKVQCLVGSKYCLYASLTDCSKPLRISTILPAKLRALLFQNCSNLGITGGSFSFAKCLRVLDLTESSISRFPSSISQLKHLRFLVAPGMKNRSFPNCISGLSKLQYLNIHRSSQVSPRPESLGKLEHLMYLDLSDCSEIMKLPERSLENLKDLVHLELSTCSGLVRISKALCYLTKLQYLNLSGCSSLERLPQDLGNLTELQYLYLSGCHKIDALPVSIGKLRNLVHLDLSRCSFVMPEALGNLSKLKYLSLSGVLNDDRKAKKTIDNISTLANLEHLDLSWNSFGFIPESMGNLKRLHTLDLSWNSFGFIPESMGNLKRLHTLDLSGCRKLESLPDSIGSVDSLEVLVIDKCSEWLKQRIRESGLKCNPLVHFVVQRNKGDSVSNLHQLEDRNPSELDISCLERLRDPGEASTIQLRNKENLSRLKLEWTWYSHGLRDKDFLEELAPPSGLKHLVLIGYGSISFPNWLMKNISHHLPNLVSVHLGHLPSCKSLPPLGQLPNLKGLCLENLESLTKISADDLCSGKQAFPQLSGLILRDMRFLGEWSTAYHDEDGRVEFMFPVLRELVIVRCPRLRLKPWPPLFHRWQITNSNEVLNFREECDRSAAPRTSLVVSTASYRGSWSLLSYLSTLEELEMELLTVATLPESMRQLVSLRDLLLSNCENIMLPEWLGDLKSLESLRIVHCQTIKSVPSSIQQLTKLERLHIKSNTELQEWCQSERNGKLAHIKDIMYSRDYEPAISEET